MRLLLERVGAYGISSVWMSLTASLQLHDMLLAAFCVSL